MSLAQVCPCHLCGQGGKKEAKARAKQPFVSLTRTGPIQGVGHREMQSPQMRPGANIKSVGVVSEGAPPTLIAMLFFRGEGTPTSVQHRADTNFDHHHPRRNRAVAALQGALQGTTASIKFWPIKRQLELCSCMWWVGNLCALSVKIDMGPRLTPF